MGEKYLVSPTRMKAKLVAGFNPFEKYYIYRVKLDSISPGIRGEIFKQQLKPPPRYLDSEMILFILEHILGKLEQCDDF